jgi:hypothetical protein
MKKPQKEHCSGANVVISRFDHEPATFALQSAHSKLAFAVTSPVA